MSLPIVFIHKGYSSYLEFSLRQAKHACPNSEIILLGDSLNDRFDFVTHVDIGEHFKGAEAFASVYRHVSSNPHGYELFCFQRWFILEEFLRSSGRSQEAFVCDSDVLLYSDLDRIADLHFRGHDLCLSFLDDKVYSAATSYWKLPALASLCRFMEGFYKDSARTSAIEELWKERWAQGRLGGYCDMSIITDFCKSEPQLKLSNLVDVFEGSTFDNQVNTPDGYGCSYLFKRGAKVFSWRDGVPYCRSLKDGCEIRFHSIHFQGPAKFKTSGFYGGPDFPGRRLLALKFMLLNFMAFWYGALKIRYRFAFLFKLIASLKGQSS